MPVFTEIGSYRHSDITIQRTKWHSRRKCYPENWIRPKINKNTHATFPESSERQVLETRVEGIQSGRDRITITQSFEQDFQELYALQIQFCQSLRIPYSTSDLLSRSFNPVVDRFHVEQLRKRGDVSGLEAYKKEMRENHKTNLKERLQTAESYGKYIIRDSKLFSEHFPEMHFGEVIKRGAEHRVKLGSLEQERESAEVVGWRPTERIMTNPNTKLGYKIRSFSPRGFVKGTMYTAWFVDEYILREDIYGQRYVERARFAVDWEYEKYKEIALRLDPTYFDGYDGRPLDAWFLANPLTSQKDIPELFGIGASEQAFEGRYKNEVLQGLLDYYEEVVFAEQINWYELATTFNTILNHFDSLENSDKKRGEDPSNRTIFKRLSNITSKISSGISHGRTAIAQRIRELGRKTPETKSGGGCPPNKGINLGSSLGLESFKSDSILSNSVAKFGVEDEHGSLEFECPFVPECGKKNRREPGKLLTHCQHCKKEIPRC